MYAPAEPKLNLRNVERRIDRASVPFKRHSAYLRTHRSARLERIRPFQLRFLKHERRYRDRLKANDKKAKRIRKRRKRYLKNIGRYTEKVRRRMYQDKQRRFWAMYTANWAIAELKAGSIVRVRTLDKRGVPETVSVLPKDDDRRDLAKAIEKRSFGRRTNSRDAVTFRYIRRISRRNAVADLRAFVRIVSRARLNAEQCNKLALLEYYLQYNGADRSRSSYGLVIPLHGLRGKRLVRTRAKLDALTNKELYGWYFFRDRHLGIIIRKENH